MVCPALDTRFADEEDMKDIAALVNAAYAVEFGDGKLAYRTPYVMTEGEVCVWSPSSRWLVSETPLPEEEMVACLNLQLDTSNHTAYITHLAVDPNRQRQGIGSRILRRAESIVRSFTCRHVEIETAHWREDVASFLEASGYRECGGSCWPQERAREVTRPHTRIVKYKKDLLPASTGSSKRGDLGLDAAMVTSDNQETESRSSMADDDLDLVVSVMDMMGDLQLGQSDESSRGDTPTSGGGNEARMDVSSGADDSTHGTNESGESLEDLVSSLFKQLRTPEGWKEFERLCAEGEQVPAKEDSGALTGGFPTAGAWNE